MLESTKSFFEGTEKKVELVVGPTGPDLLALGDDFWREICRVAGAEILSKISNPSCSAFVLSESSLFVFKQRMIMLTCGRTTLHDAVLTLLRTVAPEQIAMLFYQRKNEAYPHQQATSFFDDIEQLGASLPGRAFRFGHEDEHHLYMFHLDRPYRSDPDDMTVEVLMYGLDEEVRLAFSRNGGSGSQVPPGRLGLDRLLPGFEVDDHLFEPSGYSLNAIRDDEYYTIHVSPQEHGTYASFETNHRWQRDPNAIVEQVVARFKPRSYDVVIFDHAGTGLTGSAGYRLRSDVEQSLDCGYQVRFASYFSRDGRSCEATELPTVDRVSPELRP